MIGHHFTRTEITTGPKYTAACSSCDWRMVASSHDHSWQLGQQHEADKNRA